MLSNQMLLERVWGPEYTTETDYIKVYIQRLREKLEEVYVVRPYETSRLFWQ